MAPVPRLSPLEFVEQPYTPEQAAAFVQGFREHGFVILPDVYDRASVGRFRVAVLGKLQPPAGCGGGRATSQVVPPDAPELVEPTLAPRLRMMVPALLAPPHPRLAGGGQTTGAQLFELAWKAPLAADSSQPEGWHIDRAGGAMVPGTPMDASTDGYRYPEAVHAAMYYCDMDASTGPTELIRGSHLVALGAETHRDAQARTYHQHSPTAAAAAAAEYDPRTEQGQARKVAFTPRAQDAVLWDQRCWHRVGAYDPARVAGPDDRRLISIFGWHNCEMFHGTGYAEPYAMPASLARLWGEACAAGQADEAAMLGGRWSATSVWRELDKLRQSSPSFRAKLAAEAEVEAEARSASKARL